MNAPLQKFLEDLWQQERLVKLGANWRGRSIEDLNQVRIKTNPITKLPALDLWLEIFDEFFRWAAEFTNVLCKAAVEYRDDDKFKGEKIRVFYLLFSQLVSDMAAIRTLTDSGLDVQAKKILRSFKEYCDVVVLFCFRPEFIPEFNETEDISSSNKFWHKHISKGKLRKLLQKEKFKDIEAANAHALYEKEEEDILSSSIHPSLAACIAACMPGLADENRLEEYFSPFEAMGLRSLLSIRTLEYAVSSFSEMIEILVCLLFLSPENERLFNLDPKNKHHGYIVFGFDVLFSLKQHIDGHLYEASKNKDLTHGAILKCFDGVVVR